jgi:hypothetical protein
MLRGREVLSGFQQATTTGVLICTGHPNCDAGHAALLAGLQQLNTPFIGPTETISLSQRGNLGEFISLHIAKAGAFRTLEKFARNALQPLSGISGDGIDLTYVYFDPVSAANDLLYIQEVKTTAANNLDYLNKLEDDYRKLFSTNVNLTLQTRIQCLSNSFEVERNNNAYAERVQYLGDKTPKECSRVRLIPTGVHKLGVGQPVQKMLAIRSAIAAFGWDPAAINPWAVRLSDLEDRLLRLARGQL